MNVVGIVSEYNPFHYGHEYHIKKTRQLMGGECEIVCVMSGDFVQRGEPAVYSKFARAEAAVRCGADLVLELPLPWSLLSAEGFARGAVSILDALGVVTHLSFGSECGETKPLEQLAELLLDPLFGAAIKDELAANEGISFAAARQRAVEKKVGELAAQLEMPNNILAVEYIKSIYDLDSNIKPLTVSRFGAAHDAVGDTGPRSAAELRTKLAHGLDISGFIPPEASAVYEVERSLGRGPIFAESLEQAIMSRLRLLDADGFSAIPDAGEGLSNRLARAVREESGLDAIAAAAKSKRYALSRIRRMMMCAALGITDELARTAPPYARVLAANSAGCSIIKAANEAGRIPVLTKPAAVRELDDAALRIFELGAAAHDMYVLGCPAKEERRGAGDWRTSPKIV